MGLCQAFLGYEGEAHKADGFGGLCVGTQALPISRGDSTCWNPRTEVSSGLKACAWLPSANQHERTWSWEGEWSVSGWLGSTLPSVPGCCVHGSAPCQLPTDVGQEMLN